MQFPGLSYTPWVPSACFFHTGLYPLFLPWVRKPHSFARVKTDMDMQWTRGAICLFGICIPVSSQVRWGSCIFGTSLPQASISCAHCICSNPNFNFVRIFSISRKSLCDDWTSHYYVKTTDWTFQTQLSLPNIFSLLCKSPLRRWIKTWFLSLLSSLLQPVSHRTSKLILIIDIKLMVLFRSLYAVVVISTKWALWAVNVLTILKMIVLILWVKFIIKYWQIQVTEKFNISMVGCGIAVLSGVTHIRDPYANFRHPFEGSYWNGNALATAFVSKDNAATLSLN